MRQPIVLDTEFVTGVPDQLAEHTLYVSMEYATVAHKCCCGCGLEVVTPLSPTDWKLSYDGVSVSLHPSIGNWSFSCRSHYWIDKGKVRWAGDMSQEQINRVRAKDSRAKARYFDPTERPIVRASTAKPDNPKPGLWSWLARLWS